MISVIGTQDFKSSLEHDPQKLPISFGYFAARASNQWQRELESVAGYVAMSE